MFPVYLPHTSPSAEVNYRSLTAVMYINPEGDFQSAEDERKNWTFRGSGDVRGEVVGPDLAWCFFLAVVTL